MPLSECSLSVKGTIMYASIRLGVSTAPLFPRPLEEIFRILEEQPVREIEIMPQSPAECGPDFARELLGHGKGDFRFCSIHFPLILHPFLYNPYPSAREYGRELCRGLAALAARLQSRVLVVHAPPKKMGTSPFIEVAAENIAYLCDLCAPSGIRVGLENSPNSPAETPHQMQEWAARIGRPNLGYVLDITHAHQSNLDPLDFIQALPSLMHLHVSDYHPQNGPHQPVGQGKVNWQRLAEALHRSDFEGHVILELATNTIGEDPAMTLRESIARLSAWLDMDRGGE